MLIIMLFLLVATSILGIFGTEYLYDQYKYIVGSEVITLSFSLHYHYWPLLWTVVSTTYTNLIVPRPKSDFWSKYVKVPFLLPILSFFIICNYEFRKLILARLIYSSWILSRLLNGKIPYTDMINIRLLIFACLLAL